MLQELGGGSVSKTHLTARVAWGGVVLSTGEVPLGSISTLSSVMLL